MLFYALVRSSSHQTRYDTCLL